ncbi:MAG: methyltransferase protein [Candelina mexicana]|nr:MAG: methyltransferase protein [Candelina mexicana]
MDTSPVTEDAMPIFYVGQHEARRSLPVTDEILRQAQDCNYDMLTTPITTPYFNSRVLSLLSSHLAQSYNSSTSSLASPREQRLPIVPPLSPVDTTLTPSDTISQLVAVASPWIDICSPDPLVANVSQQVLNLEIAYAAFCGVGNVIIHGPHLRNGQTSTGLAVYARAVLEALNVGSYLQVQILLPISYSQDFDGDDEIGSLVPFAREKYIKANDYGTDKHELFASWDAWHVIRTVCKYHSRLFVALSLPAHLPPISIQSRWHSEPLRLLCMSSRSFLKDATGYPVLSRAHRLLISRYMRLRTAPWILLSDVGPIPGLNDPNAFIKPSDRFLGPTVAADPTTGASGGSPSPTPAEAAQQRQAGLENKRIKDPTPHLSYIRHLQRNQPTRSIIELFGSGYQDYLQAPLQPLTDNLESVTYEVFEKDPVKYNWYERAIQQALEDWTAQGKPSQCDGKVILAVVGAGRGPLVTRALQASEAACVPIEIYAVEKNPNAYVLLQRQNAYSWGNQVHVVKSDMRSWKGPSVISDRGLRKAKVDILVSELLGSFADNELSPECLDGVQHLLSTPHGISIPCSYTAHLTPVAAPRLHADIAQRAPADPSAAETPYVVMLHAIDFLSTFDTHSTSAQGGLKEPPKEPQPDVKLAWSFSHPIDSSMLENSALRHAGSADGGGGGLMGGDGVNEHNARYAGLRFGVKDRGVCHGLAGYFETVLYEGKDGRKVELSTNPVTMAEKSADMISWFPIYFPLKTPLYLPDNSELEISIWRQTDDRKVWYEWMVEAFVLLGAEKRVSLGGSDLHSSRKNGCLM